MTNKLEINLNKKYVIKAKARLRIKISFSLTGLTAEEFERRLSVAINQASQRIAVALEAALKDAITSSVWSTIGGTADIVDTGNLLESGTVTATDSSIVISYDAPYAAMVHYGGYILPYGNKSQQKIYLPARPWVDAVLRGGGPVPKFDFNIYYQRAIEEAFS